MQNIYQLLEEYKISIGVVFLGLVLIFGGFFYSHSSNQPIAQESFLKGSIVSQISEIKIDIAGAVKNPGVYSLTSNSRIEDAIKAAGGFKDNQNNTYISKYINLSQKVSDGQKIYIPFEGENSVPVTQGISNAGGKVSINSSSLEQLVGLPAIGDVTAQKIINGRPYQTLDDLVNKKVVSKTTFEKIKDLVDL